MLQMVNYSVFKLPNQLLRHRGCKPLLTLQFPTFRKLSNCVLYSNLDTNFDHNSFYSCAKNCVCTNYSTYRLKSTSSYKNRYSRSQTSITGIEVAYKLLKQLKNRISERDIIIEVDPGNGIFTKLLVYALNNKIILFQPSIALQNELMTRFKLKKKNIIFSPLNIHDAQKYFYKSEVLQNHAEYIDFLQTLYQYYSESSKLILTGAISSQSLLYTIMINFAHQNMFYGYLNMSLLVYVSPRIYSSIVKESKSFNTWRLGIFANLCFEVNYLGSVSSDCFETTLKPRLSNSGDVIPSNFHLMEFTPRDSIGSCENIKVDTKELAHFFYFVNYFIRLRSTTPFISALESFIPSIGKELIKNGFKVYGRPHCLTNDEWVIAFKIFSSHPNYISNPIIKMMSDDFNKLGYFESDPDDCINLEENIS